MFPLALIRCCRALALVMGVALLLPSPGYAQKSAPKRKVHILLVGLTEDKNIGRTVEYNLDQVRSMLLTGLPSHHIGSVRVLKGAALTAKSLLAAVDAMSVGANDTLFMYYHGHGAYDPTLRSRDAAGGHYLDIPSGDLLRKDLWNHLRGRKAKLTVLVTETCNIRIPATLAILTRTTSTRPRTLRESPVLRSLLLNQQGVIDINASSKDEFSWNFGVGHGGSYFTDTFVDVIEEGPFPTPANVRWTQFIKVVSDRASTIFQNARRAILATPEKFNAEIVKQFQSQLDRRVAIYHMSFIPDRADPVSPIRRDPAAYVWKLTSKGIRLNGSLLATHPKDEIRAGSHHRVYHVELKAGESYVIEMQSKDVDSYLRVEDASGRELARDDDGGEGLNARLVFHATSTGPYRIVATSYAPALGRFTIAVRAN